MITVLFMLYGDKEVPESRIKSLSFEFVHQWNWSETIFSLLYLPSVKRLIWINMFIHKVPQSFLKLERLFAEGIHHNFGSSHKGIGFYMVIKRCHKTLICLLASTIDFFTIKQLLPPTHRFHIVLS